MPLTHNAQPTFFAPYHRLDTATRSTLKELLGSPLNIADKEAQDLAMLDVERWLGFQPVAEMHVDRAPKPADYIAKFAPIYDQAKFLFKEMQTTGYYRDALTAQGAELAKIEAALVQLVNAAQGVLGNNKKLPSPKGARKNLALKQTVSELRRAFRHGYRGQVSTRKKQGAFESLSPQERNERDFVKLALLSARLIPKTYTGLPALFNDPDCSPPQEQSKTNKGVSPKVARKK